LAIGLVIAGLLTVVEAGAVAIAGVEPALSAGDAASAGPAIRAVASIAAANFLNIVVSFVFLFRRDEKRSALVETGFKRSALNAR
jgi:hypothetical protein